METRLLEFSIVIVASDCNPTILNPDFLARKNIVPDEWGWKVSGTPITTPPFATVSYDSGVSVQVGSNKFQVLNKWDAGERPETRQISEIARKYIEVLPHVRYNAVGHNFSHFVENADAEAFLKDKFLKSGVWDGQKHRLEGFGLKFTYPVSGGRLNLSLDSAPIVDRSGEEPEELHGILARANYNRDCQGYPNDEQVIEHLKHMDEDWSHFQIMLSDILKTT